MLSSWRCSRRNRRPSRQPKQRPAHQFRPRLEALEDRSLLSTFTVITAADSGDDLNPVAGSLREAILAANAHNNNLNPGGAADVIAFDIPGPGPHTIQPTAPMAEITDPAVLDGTTQPGFAGTPVIELDGSLTVNSHGLIITAGNTTVRGLVINRFVDLGSGPGSGPTAGIVMSGPGGNVIQGNYIGTNLAGDAVFPADAQMTFGVVNFNGGNIVGTDGDGVHDAAEGNLISGQNSAGVLLLNGSSDNVIAGNILGASADGQIALGNGRFGVFFLGAGPHNRIGTNSDGVSDFAERNLISGNSEAGLYLDSDANVVAGNYIGTNVDGDAALPNGSGLVITQGSNNTIGGTAAGAGNVIAFNEFYGVEITDGAGNAILGNSIHANGWLGIDLIAAGEAYGGVTPNDHLDLDDGPNRLQNFPVLQSARVAGSAITIQGNFQGNPRFQNRWRSFRIEFFANDASDPSGNGEGQRFLGSVVVAPASIYSPSFSVSLPGTFSVGSSITATLTDPDGNTSEFSAALPVSFAAVLVDGNLIVTGTTGNDSITLNATNPNNVVVSINGVTQPNPAGGSFVLNPLTGRMIVYGDAGADVIQVIGSVPSEIHAGGGNDTVYGGSAQDVIWGDTGDDTLNAGSGDDVLIGGIGRDRLNGGSGRDVLIGGFLASRLLNGGQELYDYAVLRAIADIWTSGLADSDLAAVLAADLNDSEQDQLTGGAGGDWFLGNQSAPRADILTDFSLSQGDTRTSVASQPWLLDVMSEMGEKQSLRLQMVLDRLSKLSATLSNLLLKIRTIQDQIVGNMK